ncbi:ABC transporter ATP-binding protein [Cytobacillus sp. Sa5YUA1]|uniref:ABC transporter ATP-binding protein n=1 Tax=Cytobacillus stercorigallinarum TaxID=2762240 RepID=A0ABR8QU17_9BACI|nr:ABC transporter ATP-binding protein [Cytobacillus stercorigallinarum]MBD7938998.1 ABC transporter ATP-binding protein [Cytobacillus stercorigallinarum]
MSRESLLEVRDLKTYFYTEDGVIPSVDGVSFTIKKGETVAVVGESGSGKSVTSLSIMGLLDTAGKIESGTILFEGSEVTTLSKKERRKLRGNEMAMIFQEPLTSLNPLFTVGNQISEAIRIHQKVNKKEAKKRSIEILKKVGIARAEKVFHSYPHLLSGGMRQRVMIAIALSCNPKLLIADEPTTALDVTIQAQILHLMKELIKDKQTSILFITHDLGVVAEMADQVIVMYAGQVVEYTDVFTLFKEAAHPYTTSLLASTPKIHEQTETLQVIEGTVPNPNDMPSGCRFHTRCPNVMEKCMNNEPVLTNIHAHHQVKCWLYEEEV